MTREVVCPVEDFVYLALDALDLVLFVVIFVQNIVNGRVAQDGIGCCVPHGLLFVAQCQQQGAEGAHSDTAQSLGTFSPYVGGRLFSDTLYEEKLALWSKVFYGDESALPD